MAEQIQRYTAQEKVAIFLLSLGDKATPILKLMNERELKAVSHTMSKLGAIPTEAAVKILGEFGSQIKDTGTLLGDFHTTQRLLEKALDRNRLEALLSDLQGHRTHSTWEKLGNINEETLASYLCNEHPQVTAVILLKIAPEQAAKVIRCFTDNVALDVIERMLHVGSIKKEVLDELEEIICSEFLTKATRAFKQDSHTMLASIFNHLEGIDAKYMHMLEKGNPGAASRIKNLMFTFDDLMKLDPEGLRILLHSIERDKLVLALKAASPELKEVIFGSLPQRHSQIIEEELQLLGRVRAKDVYDAHMYIIAQAKELIAKGEAVFYNSSSSEDYIL